MDAEHFTEADYRRFPRSPVESRPLVASSIRPVIRFLAQINPPTTLRSQSERAEGGGRTFGGVWRVSPRLFSDA